jgi:hypothetical protein
MSTKRNFISKYYICYKSYKLPNIVNRSLILLSNVTSLIIASIVQKVWLENIAELYSTF